LIAIFLFFPIILLGLCAVGGIGGSFVVLQKCNFGKLFCNYKRFSRSLERSLRFKPLYLLVLAILTIFYSVYVVVISAVIALICVMLATLILVLTFVVLLVPSYIIFLIVVVRK